MRILQVAYVFPPTLNTADGITQSVYQISSELAKRGHEVVVYTSNALDVHSRERISKAKSVATINSVSVYYLPFVLRRGTVIVTPSIIPLLQKNLCKFDVIHIHSCISFQGFLASIFAKKNGVPYILQAHGSVPRSQQRVSKSFYDGLFSFSMLRNASKVIALNPTEAEQYKNIGIIEEKIEIIPNGIDISQYADLPSKGSFKKKFSIKDDEKIVLYLGRIHKIKGIDILAEAFANALEKLEDVKLVVVGPDNGYLGEFERLTKALKIEDNVLVTGALYARDKLEAYIDADVYVLPSRYETFPMSVLEAVACRSPVILSEKCGVAEYFGNKVGLVVKPDSKHLEEALLEMLLDQERQKIFRNNCRTVIDQFSISQTVSKLEKVYEELSTKCADVPMMQARYSTPTFNQK